MTTTVPPGPAQHAGVGTQRPVLVGLAAGITMLLWASAFIGIRTVGVHYSAGALALGRLTVGALALTLLALRRPEPFPIPRGRPLLLVLASGVLWFGLYTVVLNGAERHLDAGTTALLVNIAPLVIAVLAGLFLGEGLPRTLGVGLVIAFAGVVTIAASTRTGRYDPTGVLLALAAAGLYAAGVLLQKQALHRVDPLTATWLGCVAGVVSCLPFARQLVHELGTAPASATAGIVYLGVFPTAIAFSTWAYALARTSAGRLSASSYLVPALATGMSWLVLAEVPAPLALVGGLLCLAGVAVTRLPDRRRRPGGAAG